MRLLTVLSWIVGAVLAIAVAACLPQFIDYFSANITKYGRVVDAETGEGIPDVYVVA